jgi:hypothetical protein
MGKQRLESPILQARERKDQRRGGMVYTDGKLPLPFGQTDFDFGAGPAPLRGQGCIRAWEVGE